MSEIKKIVLTGGPCAGKTTAMVRIIEHFTSLGFKVFTIPEIPTIYGIALDGMGDDAKFGAAGLIMAILGGSLLPPLQALIIDGGHMEFSFIVPFICFMVVLIYALIVGKNEKVLQNT